MSAEPVEAIKAELKKKTIHIDSFEQVDILLLRMADETQHRVFLDFDSAALKSYFIENAPFRIINCNSSYERFCEDMMCSNQDIVFNNLNCCNDFDILNILKDTNNILIQ